jgi:hypothetical protein
LLKKQRLPKTKLKIALALMVLLAFLAYNLFASQVSAEPTISLSADKIVGYQLGSDISGSFVVNAQVSSDVVHVEFYLNGTLQTNDTASPFNWTSNTSNYSIGQYNITAVAYDKFGHQAAVTLKENFVEMPIFQAILILVVIVVGIFIVLPLLIVWNKTKDKKTRID